MTRATCGSTWVGAGTAATSPSASQTAEPGNTDSTWPSGPTPSTMRSKTGSPSSPAGGPAPRIARAYASAAPAAPVPCAIAAGDGIGWRFAAGIRTPCPCPPTSDDADPLFASSPPDASRICSSGATFESGWSYGTNRSSPHQTWTRPQSSDSRSGSVPRRR